MQIPLYQVDAFTPRVFGGNPAAVCPLTGWPDDSVLGAIARENNLSETAFIVPAGDGVYALRWFTPVREVDLCGHATLASAHIVLTVLETGLGSVTFETRWAGRLTVEAADAAGYSMDFPVDPFRPCAVPADLGRGLGIEVTRAWASDLGNLLVETDAAGLRGLDPDMGLIAGLEAKGVVVTAAGDDGYDFISRYFAPSAGILEDPVTGSAHCLLAPFWAQRLGRTELSARQVSARGGDVNCRLRGNRVVLSGHAVTFLTGTITL